MTVHLVEISDEDTFLAVTNYISNLLNDGQVRGGGESSRLIGARAGARRPPDAGEAAAAGRRPMHPLLSQHAGAR
jgi:hypothetical protein